MKKLFEKKAIPFALCIFVAVFILLMILLIDLGNTLGKAALVQSGRMGEYVVFDPEQPKVLSNMVKMKNPHTCFISTVRDLPAPMFDLLQARMSLVFLNANMKLPFRIAYQTPETLGSDRIAAVAAAQNRFPDKNVLVIDMGSCITYDFIDEHGIYHGGAISPGLQMRLQAMHTFTGNLPLVPLNMDVPLIGKTTATSMQSGILYGIQAELKGIIERYEIDFKDLTVLLGGGDNKYFDKMFKINIFAASNLVLEGLKVILEFNAIE